VEYDQPMTLDLEIKEIERRERAGGSCRHRRRPATAPAPAFITTTSPDLDPKPGLFMTASREGEMPVGRKARVRAAPQTCCNSSSERTARATQRTAGRSPSQAAGS